MKTTWTPLIRLVFTAATAGVGGAEAAEFLANLNPPCVIQFQICGQEFERQVHMLESSSNYLLST